MINVVGVEFKNNGKTFYFDSNNHELKINDYVIVETERGLQFGKIVTAPKEIDQNSLGHDFQKIVRVASKEDEFQNEKNVADANNAMNKAVKIASELGLEMKFVDVNYTFDRNQLLFYFLSENRVDFRELAKQLASIYKTRIELRQIGVRDKAKEVSGIGPCGRKLCCASFLNDLDAVSISMAKNQNLSLNPSKINGLCGRLLCCLNYENDLYTEQRDGMPEVGDSTEVNDKRGYVISTDILNRKYIVSVEGEGKVEVKLESKCESCGKCCK
jgi:cell fate regulator YaaT (PSP1 superfamily)